MYLSSVFVFIRNVFITLCLGVFVFAANSFGQERERVVEKRGGEPTVKKSGVSAPRKSGLGNKVVVARTPESHGPLVKKTSSAGSTAAHTETSANFYSATVRSMMLNSIRQKVGIRYRWGAQGPSRYDCSGFVWKVFQESGLPFTRTSAAQYWRTFEPITGEESYQFGTLVFFNRLGHVGIVVGKDGFYHASTSKGITYSKFNDYWKKRIVGFRRVPLSALVFGEYEK